MSPYWMDILHYIVPPLLPPGGPKGEVVGEILAAVALKIASTRQHLL